MKAPTSRRVANALASAGFLVLMIGVTYFALLVLSVRFGEENSRAAHYYELGKFLSGRLEWYRDARVYGAASLLCALTSLLFGVHKLARATIPLAGGIFIALQVWGDAIWRLIRRWAQE